MAGTKVVVYGLSTEGYAIASQMAIKGADVYIIDESTPSAISLKAEIAKTYPNVSSLKEDEPLLAMEPIDVAISKAQYLFFTPRIRKTGQDIKTEIHSKFKDAVTSLKKNSSVIFTLATGFGGNNENISLLEHVTGLQAGKNISYFYYPLEDLNQQPKIIGSFNGKKDLENGYIKFIGEPDKRIKEDYLRILRYLRFYSNYSKHHHDTDVIKKIKINIGGISKLSKERLFDELKKITNIKTLEKLSKDKTSSEIFLMIFPEIKNLDFFFLISKGSWIFFNLFKISEL